jgi:uncharacterized Fe-S center protein
MGERIRTRNIKSDMPTRLEARERLNAAIRDARQDGVVVLKIIHGHGSSGVGGAVKCEVLKSLRRRRKEGRITAFLGAESVLDCCEEAGALLEKCPEAGRDPDWLRANPGVTFILL